MLVVRWAAPAEGLPRARKNCANDDGMVFMEARGLPGSITTAVEVLDPKEGQRERKRR